MRGTNWWLGSRYLCGVIVGRWPVAGRAVLAQKPGRNVADTKLDRPGLDFRPQETGSTLRNAHNHLEPKIIVNNMRIFKEVKKSR